MANWWDALPAFKSNNEMQEFIARRKDGGDTEPGAAGEDTTGPATGMPDVPTLPAQHIMGMARFRKEVAGAQESEVFDSRLRMMQNLSLEYLNMWAQRDQIKSGEIGMVTLNNGKPQRI